MLHTLHKRDIISFQIVKDSFFSTFKVVLGLFEIPSMEFQKDKPSLICQNKFLLTFWVCFQLLSETNMSCFVTYHSHLSVFIFSFSEAENPKELVPVGNKNSIERWHIIQYSGGNNAPTKFYLTLFWAKNSSRSTNKVDGQGEDRHSLIKLRTDTDRLTPKVERILMKLPPWCSLFGKSTSPHTLSFLSHLPVNF